MHILSSILITQTIVTNDHMLILILINNKSNKCILVSYKCQKLKKSRTI